MRQQALSGLLLGLAAACAGPASDQTAPPGAGDGVIIYPAETVVTMEGTETAQAVAVKDDRILAVGGLEGLQADYDGAAIDESFAGKTIVPGLIDPHELCRYRYGDAE